MKYFTNDVLVKRDSFSKGNHNCGMRFKIMTEYSL